MELPQNNCDRWLTEKEVAKLTGISVSSLQKARHHRRGMPYCKVGRNSVRYSIQDVQEFMQACRIDFSEPR